nr:unnamed protein product [Callosobruchus chinensis]
MTAKDFERLVILVGPKISKMDTKLRKAIPVQDRLAITLRFLATGDSLPACNIYLMCQNNALAL